MSLFNNFLAVTVTAIFPFSVYAEVLGGVLVRRVILRMIILVMVMIDGAQEVIVNRLYMRVG